MGTIDMRFLSYQMEIRSKDMCDRTIDVQDLSTSMAPEHPDLVPCSVLVRGNLLLLGLV